ncbi:hypothetical protein X805_15110 [Sphaerotilus natans subsp. natans DSM 6575]|uniref:Uncharacterized protein n=1 Tax=Sphaerotilus natans subsp. natans DSM 6575 TaxID=1286631 RepID=A0A059KN50_9BURK|nr:hypothetical protein X805_15110 [Sphaerotilus natans subsp. natans DSM 6575]
MSLHHPIRDVHRGLRVLRFMKDQGLPLQYSVFVGGPHAPTAAQAPSADRSGRRRCSRLPLARARRGPRVRLPPGA